MTNATTHYSRAALIAFLEGAVKGAEVHILSVHLRLCDACREEFASLRQIVEALEDGETWAVEQAQPDLANLAAAAAKRLRAVQEAADAATARLLSRPVAEWRKLVGKEPELLAAAFVKSLLAAANRSLLVSLARAREICELATHVADQIEDHSIPQPEVRAAAWRDLAYVLVRLGDGTQALQCLTVAAGAAAASADAEHQLAIVEFGRAIALYELQRYAEAINLLHAIRPVFDRFSDRRRYNATLEQEAIIYSVRGDGVAAAEIYVGLLDDVVAANDKTEMARLFANATTAFEAAAQYGTAAEYVAKAMRMHQEIGDVVEVAKDHWRLGTLLARMRRFDEAREQLQMAESGLRTSGSLGKSIVHLLLDRIELELDAGESPKILRHLAMSAAACAFEANLPIAAAEALAHLRNAEVLESDDVHHVRTFLRDLELYPHLQFETPGTAR